ncbi:MAG: right-handed parallel beta-helix repeat-containing protein [Phycisphaerales bacterium]
MLGWLAAPLGVLAGVPSANAQTIIYVNAAAAPGGNGASWATAYNDLQVALSTAAAIPESQRQVEIWIAAGTYWPAPMGGARAESFILLNNVAIYGGFSGTETQRQQRNALANTTTLSGDLNRNDTPNFGQRTDNAYHVIRGEGVASTALLDGFTITGGHANIAPGSTAGPYDNYGGGFICQSGGSARIHSCTFVSNYADSEGGAALFGQPGDVEVVNCLFIGNRADWWGGALAVGNNQAASGSLNARIANCVFSGNVIGVLRGGGNFVGGAAIEVVSVTTPPDRVRCDIVNCTFTNNSILSAASQHYGQVIYTDRSSITRVVNSIVRNGATNALYVYLGGDLTVRYSDLEGGASSVINNGGVFHFEEGNITGDPQFMNPLGPDGLAGTLDDDLRTGPASPCIETGESDDLPHSDILGNRRFHDADNDGSAQPDMGAYESGSPPYSPTLYVRESATGSNNGSSWVDACAGPLGLSSALTVAGADPSGYTEVWVAAGTYTPSPPLNMGGSRSDAIALIDSLAIYGGFAGTETDLSQRDTAANPTILSGDLNGDDIPFAPAINRLDNSFHVVKATGGVTGAVLDGFIIQNGNPTGASGDDLAGGAIWIRQGATPSIRNCTLTDCDLGAVSIYFEDPAQNVIGPTFDSCTFYRNRANGGAAVSANQSTTRFRDCVFEENVAMSDGGAAYAYYRCGLDFVRCRFTRNAALQPAASDPNAGGGAIWVGSACPGCDPTSVIRLVNCMFEGNRALARGGALLVGYSSGFEAFGTVFVGNSAEEGPGGAIYLSPFSRYAGLRHLTNCSIVSNHAPQATGGGVHCDSIDPHIIRNTIFWANTSANPAVSNDQFYESSGLFSAFNMAYCTVQVASGGLPGTGNLVSDPLFVALPSAGADQVWGTPDDSYGDLRLTNSSPAIDSANSGEVWQDTFDIDRDANVSETMPIDVLGNQRVVDAPLIPNNGMGVPPVDRGAIEYFPPACPAGGERLWVAPSGGAFFSDQAWFPCAPTATSDILFDQDAAFAVMFPAVAGNQTIISNSAIVRRGDVTFMLNSSPTATTTYRLAATQRTALTIGSDLLSPASLTIPDGIVDAASCVLGDLPGSMGIIHVSNALNLPGLGSRLAVTNGRLSVGREGTGEVYVTDGGVVESRDAIVGEQPGSFGRVIIEGTNSAEPPQPSRWVNVFGLTLDRAHVTVRDGGRLEADTVYLQEHSIIDGDGTVQAVRVVNFGEIRPGNSPGTLTILGNYVQRGVQAGFGSASGRLIMEVIGTADGEYDRINVLPNPIDPDKAPGTVRLGGGLFITGAGARDLSVPAGQGPMLMSSAGGRIGQFDVAFMPGHADSRKFLYVSYPAGLGGGTVQLNVGSLTGEFNPNDPQPFQLDDTPVAAASADFDGANGPDLVVAVPAGPAAPGSVVVLMNAGVNGMGQWMGFSQSAQVAVGVMPVSVAVGEFNRAPGRDIAVANSGDGSVMLLTNDGTGVFAVATTISIGTEPVSVSAADFNRDQYDDIAVVDAGGSASTGMLVIALNAGNPPMTPPTVIPRPPIPTGPRPSDGVPIDCDDDKDIDAFAVANAGSGAGGNSIVLFQHLGNGTFGSPQSFAVGTEPVRVIAPHLNNNDSDGVRRRDVVAVNRGDGTVSVLVSLPPVSGGPPRFSPAVNLPVGDVPTSVAAINVDFDPSADPAERDLDDDLVVSALVTQNQTTERMVVVLRNDLFNDQLAFAPAQLLGSQEECPTVVLGVDVNADTRTDVVTLNGSLPGCGRGLISPIVVRGDGVIPAGACPADINDDGIANSQDFFDFLLCFFNPDPQVCVPPRTADFNHDGMTTSQDFFDFITAFFAGCQ